MASRRVTIIVPQESRYRLIDVLNATLNNRLASLSLPSLSKSKIRRLIPAGTVRVDNKTVTVPALLVRPGASITIDIDDSRAFSDKDPGDISFELDASSIIYEDDAIIAVNKPPRFPSEATVVEGRDHLLAAVKRYLHRQTASRNVPYAGLLHRLDRETSGIIILTKTRDANKSLFTQFSEHTIQKEYIALSWWNSTLPPPDEFTVHDYLGRISSKSAQAKWGPVTNNGDEAFTSFFVAHNYGSYGLIRALPRTGRTHQIRVHLSKSGCPILGDSLYGGPTTLPSLAALTIPRILLHAQSIQFVHPLNGQPMNLNTPIPPDFLPLLHE